MRCRISQFVIDESVKGPRADVDRRMGFLAGLEQLEFDTVKVRDRAVKLLKERALPPKEVTDAFHIAVASVMGMDALLTWNCCHVTNPHVLPKKKTIVRV